MATIALNLVRGQMCLKDFLGLAAVRLG